MAVTMDIGDPKDIHPKNKQDVGKRLALWALGTVYGEKVRATSGPLPAGHKVRGSEIVLSFTHTNGGLCAKGGALKGFVIAGEDKQWKPATARIEGEKVVVSGADVKKPVAARYAWLDNPDCNLFNGAGLPASPFRTDHWPVVEEPKR
jgi:sialate O-acetylesterase